MWAYVPESGQPVGYFSNHNVVGEDGVTVADVSALSEEERIALRIYPLELPTPVGDELVRVSPDFVLEFDNETGVVRQTPDTRGKTLDEALTHVKTRIKRHRDIIMHAGITVSGDPVQTTEMSINRLGPIPGLVATGAFPAEGIDWRLADNTVKTFDAAGMMAIVGAVQVHIQTCYAVQKAHEDALDALGSVAEVISYEFNTGWPVTL